MRLLKHESFSELSIFDLQISEGELFCYEACMAATLDHFEKQKCDLIGGVNKDELLQYMYALQLLIIKYTNSHYWPDDTAERLLGKTLEDLPDEDELLIRFSEDE